MVKTNPSIDPLHRHLAAAVHIASIFAPFWLPALVFGVTRKRYPFAAAHAFQAAFEEVVWKVILFAAMITSGVFTLVRVSQLAADGWRGFSWQELGFKILISVSVVLLLGLFNAVQAVWHAGKAWRGIWPKHGKKWVALPESR